jgi:hypothetical protein
MRRSLRRMIGGALHTVCPPGFFCMDNGFVMFTGIIVVAIFVGVYMYSNNISNNKFINDNTPIMKSNTETKVKEPLAPYGDDSEYIEKPKRRSREIEWTQERVQMPQRVTQTRYPSPDRDYDSVPDLRGFVAPPGVVAVPINVPTQGLPQEFQQMGVLTAPGGSSMSASPTRTLLPLLGRRSAVSRDRYNYYTRTDGLNPIQVPVSYKNRSCEDDTGCDEIFSGDTVSVPILGQAFTATVYKYNTPRYIPLV